MLTNDGVDNSLGNLIKQMTARNAEHSSPYLIVSERGRRVTKSMLRLRWDAARDLAKRAAAESGDDQMATRIAQLQFRDIRPKAASEITDLKDASRLLGHTEEELTERVYRRVGAIAKPSK